MHNVSTTFEGKFIAFKLQNSHVLQHLLEVSASVQTSTGPQKFIARNMKFPMNNISIQTRCFCVSVCVCTRKVHSCCCPATVVHAAPSSLISDRSSSFILQPAFVQQQYCFCVHTMPSKIPWCNKREEKKYTPMHTQLQLAQTILEGPQRPSKSRILLRKLFTKCFWLVKLVCGAGRVKAS